MIRRLAPLLLAVTLVAGCSVGATAAPPSTPAPSSLPAGTYTSKAFTLPAGWVNPNDSADYLDLMPAGSTVGGIYLFRDPQPASQDSACPPSPAPGIMARDSSTLMNWIRGRPGLTVSTPTLVTVGGLPGVELDVGIRDGWKNSCPYANNLPSVPLFALPGSQNPWTIAGTERLRIDLLDRPGGGTIVVDIDAFDGSVVQSLIDAASPIVRSMSFAKG